MVVGGTGGAEQSHHVRERRCIFLKLHKRGIARITGDSREITRGRYCSVKKVKNSTVLEACEVVESKDYHHIIQSPRVPSGGMRLI